MLKLIHRKLPRRATALLLVLVLCLSPLSSLAVQYDISQGPVQVAGSEENGETKYTVNGDPVDATEIEITGYNVGNPYYVEVTAGAGATVNIVLNDLYIDNSTVDDGFALLTGGDGNVIIELNGDNTLKAGDYCAGLQKENGGTLTIQDANADEAAGKLTATGGYSAAGIGGGNGGDGTDITITGGTVTANGGYGGAGIGGGMGIGDGTNITVSGGTVTANGGKYGAGIGGGAGSDGTDITVTGGEVTAQGGYWAAGIGGGDGGSGSDITISGENTSVTAQGGDGGAGIGGGMEQGASDILITGGTVTAIGREGGAGIGGGYEGDGSEIKISGESTYVEAQGGDGGAGIGGGNVGDGTNITVSGGTVTANGGECGAGIGGGADGDGTDITITGGTVAANGGAYGAGIGGGMTSSSGEKGRGDRIEISGGTVTAIGGEGGAGIGSDYLCDPGTVTVSGDALVSVAGGDASSYTASGAGIGTGGQFYGTNPGKETEPVTDDLDTGHIDYYEAGTTAEQIQNKEATPTKTICGSQAHVAGTPQKENETAGDCYTDNEYDLVTYCTNCGAKIGTEHINMGKVHSPGTPQKENVVTGSCTVEGGYDTVTRCTSCSAILASEHTNTGKVADAHDWTPATCTEPKTCSRCQATEGAALGHTPGAAVREKEVAPQIGEAGSYDSVVYCTVCEEELSRETKSIDPLPEPEPTPVYVDDPFTAFCKALAYRIRTAEKNGTVAADAMPWPGLQRIVFEALEARPDVTLTLACRVNGAPADLTVPAGSDLLTPLGSRDMLTFEEIADCLN